MATMIAQKCKGDFDTTSLSLITLSNMQMQKDTTDMLQRVLCSQVNYCQSDKKLLGCCFWSDKICMMMTRLACNRAFESSYWRMDNDSDVGLLMGYVLYRLPVELEFMDLDTFPR
jgi:hypothetical protein